MNDSGTNYYRGLGNLCHNYLVQPIIELLRSLTVALRESQRKSCVRETK